MNNKYKKGAFSIVLILFIIFLPLTIIAVMYAMNSNSNDNPNKEFHYDNKLYFYDNGTLLGTYECQFKNCGYAKETINDDKYNINYYDKAKDISIINNKYAFIEDYKDNKNLVYLYDIKSGKTTMYKSFKYYGKGIKDNTFIIESVTGKYGVISLADSIKNVIPFEYDYIALADSDDDILSNEIFVALKDGKWYIINNQNNILVTSDNPIVDYNNTTYITKNEYYNVFNYDGTNKVSSMLKQVKYIKDDYIGLVDVSGNCYIYDLTNSRLVSKLYQTTADSKVEFIKKGMSVDIIIDGTTKETIEI